MLRVTIGEADNVIETAWLPVLQGSASATRGGMSAWVPPRIDDVVQVACPGGELSLGVVMTSQFMHANDAPFGDRAEGYEFGELGEPRDSVWRQLFADGTLIEYDTGQHLVRVETPGSVKVHACGQVIIKSPFIQMDADAVHVTGKLLLSGKVIGMNRQLTGNGPLDFLGDPIHLNKQGGVFGIAGTLISPFELTTMAGAIGDFGTFDGLFSGLVDGISAPMSLDSFLDADGLLGILPADILGAGFNALGVSNTLAPLSSAMGFVKDPDPLAIDHWGMELFATEIANTFNLQVPSASSPPIGTPGTFDGFLFIAGWIQAGEINVNDLVQIAQGFGLGLLPQQDSDLAVVVDAVLNATQQLTTDPQTGLPITPPQATSQNLMQGLRSTMAAVTDPQLADTINNQGLVQTWEMLFHGEVQPGQMIADYVNSGAVSLEELLGINTPLQREGNTDPSGGCGIQFNQPT
jgi:phage baseplate assembly protein V